MEYKTLLLNKETGIVTITINRPDSLNALSEELLNELYSVVLELEKDDETRVVIITGRGKAFVAGADITCMQNMTNPEARAYAHDTTKIYEAIRVSSKVYIAAVNGYAFGGGCELAMACDICIASENAKFALPEVGLGIIPGGGGTQRLVSRVGIQRAKEIIFTGRVIQSVEASEIGISLKTAPAESLMDEVYALADKIVTKPPYAVKYAKEAIQNAEEQLATVGIEQENELFGKCFDTSDQKEGMTAFIEKRKPDFTTKF